MAREIATAGVTIANIKADLAERDKAIKPADEVVKNYFPPHTIKSWVQAPKRGDRIPKKVKFHYDAALEKDKGVTTAFHLPTEGAGSCFSML